MARMTVDEAPPRLESGSAPTLSVAADVEPPDLHVRLSGEIDLACADLLDAVTHVEVDGITRVNIDLSGLLFSDLAGLRALLVFRGRHAAGNRVVTLTAPQPAVRRLFELTGHGDALPPAA